MVECLFPAITPFPVLALVACAAPRSHPILLTDRQASTARITASLKTAGGLSARLVGVQNEAPRGILNARNGNRPKP